MRPNKTKAKLLNDESVFGWIIQAPMPSVVELAAQAGFDFVFLDCEHGSIGEESLDDLCRAAEVVDVTPLVRVAANRPEVILRALDRGAAGVIVPHIASREDAEAAVRSSRFGPEGERGFAGYVGARWTLNVPAEDVFGFANREILVVGMVEDEEGHQALDQIIAVPGLDVVHVGPGDLSQSMSLVGQPGHPLVLAAIDDIVMRCRAAGKPAGLGGIRVNDVEGMRRAHDMGVRVFTLSFAQMAVLSATTLLAQIKGGLPPEGPGALL
jgi:4-hydroxy-2-oxoheptanedioate aldolase